MRWEGARSASTFFSQLRCDRKKNVLDPRRFQRSWIPRQARSGNGDKEQGKGCPRKDVVVC